MPRRETLQTKAVRKLSPRTLKRLPSPVLQTAKEELATHIQRTFRNRNYHATYRKGSKMTKNAMRRQLYNTYANPGVTFDSFIDDFTIMYNLIDEFSNYQVLSQQEKIKRFIDNLERPLLEKLYNYTWVLQDDEEDVTHIQNPMYFSQSSRQAGRTRKRNKKK
tara:strand:+ start:4680 stop:5168 length:489 start_codon:yes stop_codon:yes gene_type:complete